MSDGDTEATHPSSAAIDAGPATPPAPEPVAGRGRKGAATKIQADAMQAEDGAAPTQPRAVDVATGLQLDEYGLPLSGPARRRWLADAGVEVDPAHLAADEMENGNG